MGKVEIEMLRDAIGKAEEGIEIIEEFFTGDGTPPWKEDEVHFHHIHDHLSWAVHEMIEQLKRWGWHG